MSATAPYENAWLVPVDAMMPPTTASTINPMTSSMTAAPRMMRASAVCRRPRSLNTRAVIPTLVAHRVAPTKACTYTLCAGKSHALTAQPRPKGVMTPRVATASEGAPTFSI